MTRLTILRYEVSCNRIIFLKTLSTGFFGGKRMARIPESEVERRSGRRWHPRLLGLERAPPRFRAKYGGEAAIRIDTGELWMVGSAIG